MQKIEAASARKPAWPANNYGHSAYIDQRGGDYDNAREETRSEFLSVIFSPELVA